MLNSSGLYARDSPSKFILSLSHPITSPSQPRPGQPEPADLVGPALRLRPRLRQRRLRLRQESRLRISLSPRSPLSSLSLSLSLPLPLPLFLFYPLLFAACLPSCRSQSFSPTPLHPPRSCSLSQQLYPLIILSDTLTPSLFLSISPHPHQSSLPAHACSP